MSTQTVSTLAEDFVQPEPTKPAGPLLATDVKVTGQPLDPNHIGRIIKPRELVDSIEVTPLSRSEMILYNQLLANAWNDIRERPVHKILKAALRGSHDSNDRLEEAFDTLMTAYAKVRARDPKTGKMATYRLNLLGTNKEEDARDGYFHYTFPPDLLAIIGESTTWAAIKSNIMYALRSKYSIRLYEMIERRIGLTKQYEEFTVDVFRAMVGVPGGQAGALRRFQQILPQARPRRGQPSDRLPCRDIGHQEGPRGREAVHDLAQEVAGRYEPRPGRAREEPRRPPRALAQQGRAHHLQ